MGQCFADGTFDLTHRLSAGLAGYDRSFLFVDIYCPNFLDARLPPCCFTHDNTYPYIDIHTFIFTHDNTYYYADIHTHRFTHHNTHLYIDIHLHPQPDCNPGTC
jgi:hypothetical protein